MGFVAWVGFGALVLDGQESARNARIWGICDGEDDEWSSHLHSFSLENVSRACDWVRGGGCGVEGDSVGCSTDKDTRGSAVNLLGRCRCDIGKFWWTDGSKLRDGFVRGWSI